MKYYVVCRKLVSIVHKENCGLLKRSEKAGTVSIWDRDPTQDNELNSSSWYRKCVHCFKKELPKR